MGDGVGSETGEAVGEEVSLGDACGEDVQLNARDSTTNPIIIAGNLRIVAEACRGAPNGHAWYS